MPHHPRHRLGRGAPLTCAEEGTAAGAHRALLDLVEDPLMVIDRDFRVRYANRAARDLSPLDDPVARGVHCHQLSHRRPTPCDEPCPLQQVLATGAPVRVRHLHMDALGGERVFDLTATPVMDAWGQAVEMVEVCRDVTEREELRRKQRNLRRRLVHAEQPGRGLAGGVADDLRNLATIIASFAELADDSIAPTDPARGDLDAVLETAGRARNLVRQLLTLSGSEPGSLARLDVASLLREAAPALRRLVPDGVELRVDAPDPPLVAMADEGLIQQVLVNLTANARDATPPGGVIAVRAARVAVTTSQEAIRGTVEPGDWVCLTVEDSGAGVPEEHLPHIFEPFWTTRSEGRGAGLGLPMTLATAEIGGGRLQVHTTPGKGSAFHLYLPVAGTRSDAIGPDGEGDASRVLVVDDDPGICRIVRRTLERQGYEVMVAADGVEALDVWKRSRRQTDLVITDAVMPVMGGLALTRELRELDPKQRVLLMSGFLDGDTAPETLARQGIRLMSKPFTGRELVKTVEEILGRGGEG